MTRRIAVTVVFALSVAACLHLARSSQSVAPIKSGSGSATDIPWTSYPYPDPAEQAARSTSIPDE